VVGCYNCAHFGVNYLVGVAISQMIYLRLWQWIEYEKTVELSPVIALLLAPSVYPFEGESHRVVIVALYSPRVTAHTIVLVMSKQLFP